MLGVNDSFVLYVADDIATTIVYAVGGGCGITYSAVCAFGFPAVAVVEVEVVVRPTPRTPVTGTRSRPASLPSVLALSRRPQSTRGQFTGTACSGSTG